MSAEEGHLSESASEDEKTWDASRQIPWRRGRVLGILIAAIIVAELTKDVIFLTNRGDWLPACVLLYYGLLACLPFLLARMAPKAAGFDVQWLPSSRWHWAWFFGMVILLLISKVLLAALAAIIIGSPPPRPPTGPVTPLGIVFHGIAIVFVGPVAEEIFFRGYVLEQCRKLTRSGVALLIQALLFALYHLYTWGLLTTLALSNSVHAFFFAMILGVWRIKFRSLLPLVLAHVLFNAIAIVPLKARYDQVTGRSRPIRHTVSRETTYITGPLRKDGSVDYVAALNQRTSQGVTPENNAAVLFWQAVGPEEMIPAYRDRYFQMLGIPPLVEKGDYFVCLEEYLGQQKDGAKAGGTGFESPSSRSARDLLEPALKQPWSKQEFPVLAVWLAANERPLALLVEASKRPRRYDPLVCREKEPLIAVLQPAISVFHKPGDVADALIAQAMLRLSEGKVDESWEGLLACHRLARLVGQGPMVVEGLRACSIEHAACDGDQALLQHGHLTAAQASKMRQDLDQLSAMPKMADKLDVADRFTYLDNVSHYSREGVRSLAWCIDVAELEELAPELNELENTIKSLIHYGAGTEVDWDLSLRMGNSWFDRIADAYGKPTRAERSEAVSNLDKDFHRLF
jgi:membrane protease YdiL (CAAX protease family)